MSGRIEQVIKQYKKIFRSYRKLLFLKIKNINKKKFTKLSIVVILVNKPIKKI